MGGMAGNHLHSTQERVCLTDRALNRGMLNESGCVSLYISHNEHNEQSHNHIME